MNRKFKIKPGTEYVLITDTKILCFKSRPRTDKDIPRVSRVLMQNFMRVPAGLELSRVKLCGNEWKTIKVIDRYQPYGGGAIMDKSYSDRCAEWIVRSFPEYEKTSFWESFWS